MSHGIASTLGLLTCALTLVFAPASMSLAQTTSTPSAQTVGQFAPEQLEAMVAPYLDLPTPVLARIFSASKYPEAVAASAAALQTPPTATVDAAQLPPSLVGLIQSEPQLVTAMADDIEGTALLGAAYQAQPGDVWIAVGAARTRAEMLAAAEPEPDTGEAAEGGAPPPPAAEEPPPPAETPPPAIAAEAPPAAAPAPSLQGYAEPAYAAPTTYAPVPPNTVVVQEPVQTGYSGGTVAATGLIGFGLGAVAGAALADDDDGGDDYDIDIDQAYDYRRDLQEERQDYGEERYEQRTEDRQEAYETRHADREQARATRQTTGQESQAARQSAAQQRQASRQEAQGSRQASAQQRQVSREGTQSSRQASVQPRQTSRQTIAQPSQGSRQASTTRQGRASRSSADSGNWGPFASSAGGSRRSDRRR